MKLNKAQTKLHEYLLDKVQNSGKSNQQIADEIGTTDPSFISAMIYCRDAIPPRRLVRFARAVNASPAHLRRLSEDAAVVSARAARKARAKAAKSKEPVVTVTVGPKDAVTWVSPLTVQTNHDVGWILVKDKAPPVNKAHFRWDGRTVHMVRASEAIHAPHADITMWAPFTLPNPPRA